jgi:hypothetical protein
MARLLQRSQDVGLVKLVGFVGHFFWTITEFFSHRGTED